MYINVNYLLFIRSTFGSEILELSQIRNFRVKFLNCNVERREQAFVHILDQKSFDFPTIAH